MIGPPGSGKSMIAKRVPTNPKRRPDSSIGWDWFLRACLLNFDFMRSFLCCQCGTQFGETAAPPDRCLICEDERQFVRWNGQAWTDALELARDHRLEWRDDRGVTGIGIEPAFAIGQRALLIEEADGCVLWDCTSLVTPGIVGRIVERGGLKAIAISHPHFYGAMADWSEAFGNVSIYIHADDRDWVVRSHPSIVHWEGETHRLSDTLTLIRCGGHFAGGALLHWTKGANGKGALFVGDIAAVTMDRKHVSFMYSYPNNIPLGPAAVRRIASAIEPLKFDRIYGAFWDRNIASGAREAFRSSVNRHLTAIALDTE
jgi:glyoxylase-like metal-dependent hydrolase (beta-lactamase superfamily II)